MPLAPAQVPARSPLKWAGGKRWQVPYLRALWARHSHRRLVEPFAGGLAVSLGLSPERALLNDANPHLINFYQWVQRGLRVTLRMANDERLFYRHRTRFNQLIAAGREASEEAAGLFYFLNRTGYNGLCRFNRRGEFNVPFGRYTRINYTRDFSGYRDVLASWTFASGDVADVPIEPRDFVYADPPYDVEFTAYSRGGFSWDDQVRTAELVARHTGPAILVNQATTRIESLYRRLGFRLEYLEAPRRISCDGLRVPAREVVALRNV
jgi:DNA adenine methylase